MNDSIGRSVVSGYRAVLLCFLGRNKARRCLALCFGLLVVVVLALFSQQGGHNYNCSVKFTVQADYFDNRSVEIMRQRVGDLYKGFSSEIPYYYDYVKPKTSLRKASEDDFQPVEVNSSYVYSAYLDDRLAPDVDPKALPVVRIFTVLPRNATDGAKRNWHCVFWYEMVDLPLVMPVVGITNLDVMDTSHGIISTMVLCSVPTTLTSTLPSTVSLVNDICQDPQNHLPVIDLRKRRQNFEKLSSNANDTSSWNHDKVSNFTICIPPLFGNHTKTMEIIEFIELNRLLGADKFVFYLESPKQELVSCLQHYSKVGLVELHNWTLPFKQDDIHYHGQIVAQNDCLFRVMYRTKYLINQDLDEFIIPTRNTHWQTMLELIHMDERNGDIDSAASYNFRNLFFRLQEASDSSLKEPFKVRNYELKTLAKTICSDILNPWKYRSKIMGRPERLLIWHVHEIYDSSLVRKGDVNVMVDESDGLLFHYRDFDSDNYFSNTTNRRMWRYQRQLFASVISVAGSSGCRM